MIHHEIPEFKIHGKIWMFLILSFTLNLGNNGTNTFHYGHIICNDNNFDFCLEMIFHCNGNDITTFAYLKEVSKCSFKGEDIFVSSKNCLEGIEQENWNLEVQHTY